MIKNNKGITLVALIVTVVVLAILAGITMKMAIGNKGIINTTKEVSTELEQLNTIVTQSLNEAVIDGYGSILTMKNLYNATKDVNGFNDDGTLKVGVQKENDGIKFIFKNSMRMYYISKDGKIDENYTNLKSLDEIKDEFKDITNVDMIEE